MKRSTLLELIDYVNTERGQKIFAEPRVMEDCISMVSTNIFRCLPPQIPGYDVEEDEPVLEPSWPHLQVVYEFLLRFVVSKEVDAKYAKRKDVIDQTFCLKLVQVFDSEDPRERDYLKTILHRVYGKFTSHRSFIRRQMSYTFQRFAFDTLRHNGIGELLEILGSIINGFALPLKSEHLRFLLTSLLPLHRAQSILTFHHQLSYCIIQYIEKDSSIVVPVIKGLARYWPWSESSKQITFLNELEDVLETVAGDNCDKVLPFVLKIVTRSIASEHFQVVERTLYLWNNETLANSLFGQRYSHITFPHLYRFLREKENHWNPTVKSLSEEVLRLFQRFNGPLLAKLEADFQQDQAARRSQSEQREQSWKNIKAKYECVAGDPAGMGMTQATFVQPLPAGGQPGTGTGGAAPPDAPMSQLSLR